MMVKNKSRKPEVALISLAAGLIALAVVIAALLGWSSLPGLFRTTNHPVHITEIMPGNLAVFPDEDGDYHAWIELVNRGDEPVNLNGYAVSDNEFRPQKWILPEIILEPDSYAIIFLSGKNRVSSENTYLHADFKINQDLTVITLINNLGNRIDKVDVTHVPDNMSYGRDPDHTGWLYFAQPTPGKPNSTQGFADLDAARQAGSSSIIITEVMASNRRVLADEDGEFADWIEIRNISDDAVDLQGYMLSDDPENLAKWIFPSVVLDPGQHLLVFASGKDRRDPDGNLHANFRINREYDKIKLTSSIGYLSDSVIIDQLPTDIAYGRDPTWPNRWLYFLRPTPGRENDTPGIEQLDLNRQALVKPVIISEIMASNRFTLLDEDGTYPDWIELYNTSSTPINLEGFMLSDDPGDPAKWVFPELIIEPDHFVVVFASSKDRRNPEGNLHTNFNINRDRDVLYFRDDHGAILDRIEIEDHRPDVSYGRDPDNPDQWFFYPSPTPGRENTTYGFEHLDSQPDRLYRQLQLNEIMSMNTGILRDDEGDYVNWIEILNRGDHAVNLQGVGLSDQKNNPLRWTFPNVELDAGERLLIFASGKDRYDLENGILHTNFGIRVLGEPVLLSDPLGRTIDLINLPRLPENMSFGRTEDLEGCDSWHFFADPAPGMPNGNQGYAGLSKPPVFSLPGGFYDGHVQVELLDPDQQGEIRYTLDGSRPDANSQLYTQPLWIDRTTVVRANVFSQELLAFNDHVQTFFIDARHTLPVVSIAIDPDDFSHPVVGMHSLGPNASPDFPHWGANFHQDWERPAHFEFYEPDGRLGYRLHIGFRIFGAFSRAMEQKSFSVYARNRYEYDEMTYPFLENKDLIHFKHLVLRTSGQDASMSKIRDILMTSLIQNTTVDYQGYRQSVLYINGQYWGIYNIREKINRYFIDYNHGLEDLDAVDILEGNGIGERFFKAGDNEHYMAMLDYIRRNDMSKPENYDYIQTILDVENYADYQIAQIYFANTDNGNIRYWRERSDEGKWRWIIYDLDWGFFNVEHNSVWHVLHPVGTGYNRVFSTVLIRGLLENDVFRQMFIERFAWHMNETFQPDHVIALIDRLAGNITPEMVNSLERWSSPSSMETWEWQVERLRDFARRRPEILVGYIQRHFGLSSQEMQIFDAWSDKSH